VEKEAARRKEEERLRREQVKKQELEKEAGRVDREACASSQSSRRLHADSGNLWAYMLAHHCLVLIRLPMHPHRLRVQH
jgi:hypothetical protein